MTFRRSLLPVAALILAASLSACANMPNNGDPYADIDTENDPIEPVNRAIFDVNDFLDRLLLRPLAELYRATVPPGIRDRVTHVVSNMKEPVYFANNVMQGEFTKGGESLGRLVVNSTAGVGGMWDVASEAGLDQQYADFGQTLHAWGLGTGPYLVLPLFGPSNLRDTVGMIADTFMSPWPYIARIDGRGTENRLVYSSFAAEGLTRREQNIEAIDALRSGSLDFYAQMRSVYRQYRAKQLGGESTEGMPKFDDYQ